MEILSSYGRAWALILGISALLTLEFSSAGGANTYEVVTMTGVIVAGYLIS